MREITYPFSFPVCDLLICEFPPVSVRCDTELGKDSSGFAHSLSTSVPYLVSSRPSTLARPVPRIRSVAAFIYQKVVRRQPIAYQVDPVGHPGILGCYVREHLECGLQQLNGQQSEVTAAFTQQCSDGLYLFLGQYGD